MPSISESPLEQDFTIEGVPSKLGCPFASMAKKKLSSHAASVLSRYNHPGSTTSPVESVSRINGRDSVANRDSRRASFADPIKAEICGLSDRDQESPLSERAMRDHLEQQENADVGVCPIRFLDQHSPEEVATYFEKHKHELPRSHEVCVKRYQSNEAQIQQLDAKYGNLVSMIQGLGAKHKDMLPKDPEDAEETTAQEDAQVAEKVRKWASSVSVQAVDGNDEAVDELEERKPHFERPLRDVRLGESPSRPWGIQVPAKYLEKTTSEASSTPARLAPAHVSAAPGADKPAQCPFGFDKGASPAVEEHRQTTTAQPAFIAPVKAGVAPKSVPADTASTTKQPPMTFSGPVFIGYSAEDAIKILRESGLAQTG